MASVEWAVLCDYAFQDVARKTCLIGIFDRIFARAVPAQHHQAAFVFKLIGDPDEEVDFKIEITRPAGGTLGSVGAKIKIPQAGTIEVLSNLQGLPLPDYGPYAFTLYLGSELAKVVGVTVIEPSKAGAPPLGGAPSS